MKQILQRIFHFGEFKYHQYGMLRIVKQKLHYIKSQNSFIKFPLDNVTPVVSNYSFYRYGDKKWLDFFYSVHGKPSSDFIPLNIYYQVIEPLLNNYALLQAIKEKNFYNKYYSHIKTPLTLLRRINGCFYDTDFNPISLNETFISKNFQTQNELIIKPSIESGGGKSIMKFVRNNESMVSDNKTLDIDFLINYSNDFIIQQVVKQHKFFRQFNPGSNNTLRVFTYRSVITDKVHILHTILRIGKTGAFMDHDNLGGIAIAVKNDGYLNTFACDVNGMKVNSFNGITFSSLDKVPFLDKVYNISIDLASQIYYGHLLALDFTFNETGDPLLIEINCQGNGVSQYQMNNGSLFGEYTKEILDFCQQKMKN